MLKSLTPLVALTLTSGLWFTGAATAAEQGKDEAYQPEIFRYLTFLVGFGATPAPSVSEDSKASNGATTHYEWEGGRDTGFQGTVSLFCGRTLGNGGGFQFGSELAFATYNLTPHVFESSSGNVTNTSPADLNCRTVGLNLIAGWEYGIRNVEDMLVFVTIDAFGGGGLAWAQNQLHTGAGATESANGVGGYFEAGARVGVYLTEQRWVYGVNVSYVYGLGEVKMDFDTSRSSSVLELERNGFGITGLVGYRF